MADRAGTLERLAIEIANTLRPIAGLFGREQLQETLAGLGTRFPDEVFDRASFEGARNTLVIAARNLGPVLESLIDAVRTENLTEIVSQGLELLDLCRHVVGALDQVRTGLAGVAGLPGITPAQVAALTANFDRKIIDFLIVRQLDIIPEVGSLLTALGLIDRTEHPGDPANPTMPPWQSVAVRFDLLAPLLGKPQEYFQNLYQWGSPAFDGSKLFTVLELALARMGLPTLTRTGPDGRLTLEAFAFDIRPTSTGSPKGLEVDVVMPVEGNVDVSIPLPVENWTTTIKGTTKLAIGTSGTIRPPLLLKLKPPTGEIQGQIDLQVAGSPPEPFVVLGQAGKSRVEVGGVDVGLGFDLSWNTAAKELTGNPRLSGKISKGKVVVDMSSGDGFLSKILGGFGLESDFDVGFNYSLEGGLAFTGSSTLEIQLPVHFSIGPVEVSALTLGVGFKDGQFPINVTTNLKAPLGPLQATVEQIGITANLSFPPNRDGKLGPVDFSIGFKPPKGIGLSIDAGIVKGGGYLFLDFEKQEYAGALELVFSGFLSLKAIGLVTTKMPDGSKGFSLLIIITAEFGTGIQLGFGFTLLAVGGLIGLNRTIRMDVLTEGIRTGTVNSIMFPKDVIANAPKIISDLRAIFPPVEGRFLIGPMAKLGWGTPTLVSLSLGIIIEILPGNIAIIGVLRIALPADEFAVVVLQVNFLGAFEPEKKRFYFFASLFDSRILFITLSGELGVLMAFGDDANFVLSVGGFHPRFTPPPLPFPTPQRLAINIINESYACIRIEGYFAVTTNSVQFGVMAEARFGFDDFGISGHFQFDALFQFSPFLFDISGSSSFSIKVFGIGVWGISISFQLQGPTPWRIRGTGSISLLFFDIDVDFDTTWGESQDTSLPPIAVLRILAAELSKAQCWRAELPVGSNLLVSLRPLDADEVGKVLHPVGTLKVSQKSVPLDLTITKVGNQKVSDANRIRLDVQPASGLQKRSDLFELFAPAQFRDFDNAAKLSSPAFAPEHGGIELTGSGGLYATKTLIKRSTRYELILIDSKYLESRFKFYPLHLSLFGHWIKGASVSQSVFSAARKKELTPFDDRIRCSSELFSVARMENNKAVHSQETKFSSESQAQDYLRKYVRDNPSQAGQVHVVPQFEVAS